MIEFTDYRPNPCSPIILVDRVCGIYCSGGLMKCTFGLEMPGHGGPTQVAEQASLIWQPHALMSAHNMMHWAFEEWQKGTFKSMVSAGDRILKQ